MMLPQQTLASTVDSFKIHDPLCDGISHIRLLDYMGSSMDIVHDARQSFDIESPEFGEREQKLINYLVEHRHTSPFRGVVFKWHVRAPLFVARQWWKHVIGCNYANDQLGWNEKSFRYCEADMEQFYVPVEFRKQSKLNKQASAGIIEDEVMHGIAMQTYVNAIEAAKQAYGALIAAGVSREQARGILPPCHYTSFVWTCSLQALLHFLSLRQPGDAQSEIQAYANVMAATAESIVPEVFQSFKAYGHSF